MEGPFEGEQECFGVESFAGSLVGCESRVVGKFGVSNAASAFAEEHPGYRREGAQIKLLLASQTVHLSILLCSFIMIIENSGWLELSLKEISRFMVM